MRNVPYLKIFSLPRGNPYFLFIPLRNINNGYDSSSFSSTHFFNTHIMSTEEQYATSCAEVKAAGAWSDSIPNERKLISYGLYKQITAGDNTTAAPWVRFQRNPFL